MLPFNTVQDSAVLIDECLDNTYFYRNEKGSKQKDKKPTPLSPGESLSILLKHTGLQYLRIYNSLKIIYFYFAKYKCYFKVSERDLALLISHIFTELNLPPYFTSSTYIERLVKDACVRSTVSYMGSPQTHIAYNLIAVSNGVLDLDTLSLFKEPCPKLFVVSYLPFAYDPDMATPWFDAYLEHISGGVEDIKRFVRAYLYIVIRGETGLQCFLFLYGDGGSGKSTLTTLAHALVGDQGTHATSLTALNSDQFEAVNLEDKKLLLIGDTDNYTRDIGPLKALTGGDPIRGRVMHANATRDVYLRGNVMMTGNQLLNVRDSSGAIMRRMIPLKISKVPKKRENMLCKNSKGEWIGRLASELPGILAYTISTPPEYKDLYIKGYHDLEGLREGLEEAGDILNPLRWFVREALQEGKGAFVGFKPQGNKEKRDFAERNMLYDTYIDFSSRRGLGHPVSHRTFTNNLMEACKQLGYEVEKVRRPIGAYIKGIIVKPTYWNPDVAAGGPLDTSDVDGIPEVLTNHYPTTEPVVRKEKDQGPDPDGSPVSPVIDNTYNGAVRSIYSIIGIGNEHETTEPSEASSNAVGSKEPMLSYRDLKPLSYNTLIKKYFTTSEPRFVDSALPSSFIDDYNKALSFSSIHRRDANRFVREINEEEAVNYIMDYNALYPEPSYPEPSPSFLEGMREQIVIGVRKLQNYGCIPSTYKQMRTSPRISPVMYGDSIVSTKKIVRHFGYGKAASVYKSYGYTLVNVDLRSTYTAVLLGLYPKELVFLNAILKHTCLWDSIRKDFEKVGLSIYFDKPSVKVCVYACLFGGGKKDMFKAIMDNTRKLAGLTTSEFRTDEMYHSVYELAGIITFMLLEDPVVREFYDISQFLLNIFEGSWLTGPSGHRYRITAQSFQSVFPCYLESYEFSLLAVATLELVKQHPKVEVIGHFHDGNVLAIPTDNLKLVINDLKANVLSVGKRLELSFPIDIEVQKVFDPL